MDRVKKKHIFRLRTKTPQPKLFTKPCKCAKCVKSKRIWRVVKSKHVRNLVRKKTCGCAKCRARMSNTFKPILKHTRSGKTPHRVPRKSRKKTSKKKYDGPPKTHGKGVFINPHCANSTHLKRVNRVHKQSASVCHKTLKKLKQALVTKTKVADQYKRVNTLNNRALLDYQVRVDGLLVYIKQIQHGMHFVNAGEEEKVSCSRLDFI